MQYIEKGWYAVTYKFDINDPVKYQDVAYHDNEKWTWNQSPVIGWVGIFETKEDAEKWLEYYKYAVTIGKPYMEMAGVMD